MAVCGSAFEEHSTYSSSMFVEHPVRAFPCRIECIQIDNESESTSRFTSRRDKLTLSHVRLGEHVIWHKLIRPFTPKHNGKAEQSHRKDNEQFYATHDFAKQLEMYNQGGL